MKKFLIILCLSFVLYSIGAQPPAGMDRSAMMNVKESVVTGKIFDDDNNKNTVISDHAIMYDQTGLIDLQGNVVLTTSTNDTLFTEQLFYDQKKEWLFTNILFQIQKANYYWIFNTEFNF